MRPHRIRFVKRFAQLTALVVLINIIFPPPVETVGLFASVVVDRHGVPLRAFADKQGIWRYPVKPHEISPNYLEALINYEDRYFWLHPGVNPIALLRAFKQNISHGRIISGGSTITMQVARLIDPHSRNLGGKLKQVFRAIQLELMYSKTEILTLYLNRAPFGGPIEGVQAAAFTYLGKSAQNLSDAEAALLAVLPQAPSFNRPDRYPQRAQKVRDKLIERMQISGVWTSQRAQEAKLENVWAEFNPQPMNAPLLSRYVISQNPGQGIYHSTIDFGLQQGLASFVRDQALMLPAATSIAVLVADNRSLAVRAYVGSGAFNDDSRFGHVDMVQATRSPGSTLKPFLYGMAMDQGLIHSESLLSDAPSNFGDYSPENFGSGFEGPIGVTQALQKSLNVPAVQVLDALGSNVFLLSLKNAGMKLSLPMGAKANLAITLGGVGTSLFDLVGAYTAFANNGLAGKLRVVEEMPVNRRYILSPGSAWITRQILSNNRRSDRPAANLIQYDSQMLAWKTGTSYGYRDSWAIGTLPEYTIGVWVGRPDGTPLPGYYGAVAAAPILFQIANNVNKLRVYDTKQESLYKADKPFSVSQEVICWPLGQSLAQTQKEHCHLQKLAYTLDGNTPATLKSKEDNDWAMNPLSLRVSNKTGHRLDESCNHTASSMKSVALWPKSVEPWVLKKYRRIEQIPPTDKSCDKPPNLATGSIQITGIHDDSILRVAGASNIMPRVELHALGGNGTHHWFINGSLEYSLQSNAVQAHEFTKPGNYTITVVDEMGEVDEVRVVVLGS